MTTVSLLLVDRQFTSFAYIAVSAVETIYIDSADHH